MKSHIVAAALMMMMAAVIAAKAADPPDKPARVRIVDCGQDFLRDGDGRPKHQFHVHRWQAQRDPNTGLARAPDAVQLDLTFDVDGDGKTDDDVVAYHEFSLTRPFSPEAPWYDSLAGSPRWYGGAAIYQADRRRAGFSEDGVNQEHDGPMYLPRDNWALFHETYEINSPYRLGAAWIWKKADFLNGGADSRVSFDDNSELALYLQRYFMCVDGVRFLVRDGEQFYLSEQIFRGAGRIRGEANGKQHVLRPAETRWAPYDPKPPHAIWFDASKARFEKRQFNDVRAVGFYVFKDRFIPSYFGFKWYAFEADALVHRPNRPSENAAMTAVAGTQGVPDFFITAGEVWYELWKKVFRLARSNTFVRDPRGFIFDRDGDMGPMDAADGPRSPKEPVTDITLHDAAAWCNALSQQEGKTPCYYEDAEFKTVFRYARRSPLYGPQREKPKLFVKWGADGYRLPTAAECAAAEIKPGDYWSLAWAGDSMTADAATAIGGARDKCPAYLSFRLVRREAGLAAPPTAAPADDVRWRVPVRWMPDAPANPKPGLEMARVPNTNLEMARHETSYAKWRLVRDWALAHGYEFDSDGDMGSMDYWGMGDGWGAARAHTPDEPVTDVTYYDLAVWCNALSEIEGRTPVYYADEACKQVYKQAFIYRPLMQLFFETEADQEAGRLPRDRMLAVGKVYVKPGADGYRIPTSEEHAAAVGARHAAPKAIERGWLFDNSGGTTHPVGTKPANEHGFFDIEGNVSELCAGDSPKWDVISGVGVMPRCGGSFIDLAIGLASTQPAPRAPAGWGYPDVGFRVARRISPPRAGRDNSSGRRPLFLADAVNGASRKRLDISPENFDPLDGRVARGSLLCCGVVKTAGPATLGSIKWKFPTGGPIKSSPVVVDGIAYVGSNDGHVYAINGKSGAQVWKLKTDGPVTGSAAVVGGVVYIASENGVMYAVDAATGKPRWQEKFSRNRPCGSPALVGGVVLIGAGAIGGSEVATMTAGPIVGLDTATGRKVWESDSGPQGYAAICTDGKAVFAGSNGSFFAACDLARGDRLWSKIPGHQDRQFGTMARSGNRVYFAGSMAGSVNAHDAATGRPIWMAYTYPDQVIINNGGEPGYEILGSPAVAHDRVYVGCNDGRLHTFSADKGQRGWVFATGGPIQSSPTVAGNVVYFGSHDAHLYAVDALGGKELGKIELGGRIVSTPWPADGVVYVGCDDGNLYAVR